MKEFLKRKDIEISWQRYGIDVLGSMAYGLFASLLVGTILNTIGKEIGIEFLTEYISPIASKSAGAAIGIAVAYALKAPPLVLFASAVVGTAGYELGGPVGTLFSVLIGAEFGKMVSKETKIDILITPIVTILVGGVVASFLGPPLNALMSGIGAVIIQATNLRPFLMGVIVSVIVGMVLTLPISSAALCMMLGLAGLAGGAAAAGCSAQMIGFAVISFKENGWGGLSAIGIGTSMLQVPNIMRNWKIWIPPTVASAVVGPLSTIIFKMENTPLGSGMGTCGLVGQIEAFNAMEGTPFMSILTGILVTHILLPAVISYVVYLLLRKKGWIKDGDLKLKY